jgi:uncharacterized protein
MRLAFTADLHGNLELYRALLALARDHGCQAALVGGDLLPHTTRRADAIAEQRAFIGKQLGPLLAEARAEYPALDVYLLPGNDDWQAAIEALADLEAQGLLRPLHRRAWQLAPDLWLAGYACVPLSPFSIKDYERRDVGPLRTDFSFAMAYHSAGGEVTPISAAALAARPSIAEDLEELAHASDPSRTIYVCHAPPADTALDLAPRGRHLGSQAIRSFIARHAPLATLHGHIHEAPRLSGRFSELLGTTWSICAGQDGQRLHAVVFDTDDIAGTLWHTIYGHEPSSGDRRR